MESHPCGEELDELVVESTVFLSQLLADVDGIEASIERESRDLRESGVNRTIRQGTKLISYLGSTSVSSGQ
jgi:hypothetical protein